MTRCGIILVALVLLSGCAGTSWHAPDTLEYRVIHSGKYDIATYQKISDEHTPIRVYIEGDGNAFNAYGHPTSDPTPRGTMLRDMVARDDAPNVAYVARPCQFVMSPTCTTVDWTSGRFSADVVDSVSGAIRTIAQNRPVILIGYSGGAMLAALIIDKNPDLNVRGWISLAGVLNHSDWTEYFGDSPLKHSLTLDTLPQVTSCHYVAERDKNVPRELSRRWIGDDKMIVVPRTSHGNFGDMVPVCSFVD